MINPWNVLGWVVLLMLVATFASGVVYGLAGGLQ